MTPTTPPDAFQVVNKDIVVHLGDVKQALSCMIRADGIVMGCSTLGQVAGMLSEGISMFSTRCNGRQTGWQYKMMPALAVAERGHMWVPVAGSWHDLQLNATDIFRAALDSLPSLPKSGTTDGFTNFTKPSKANITSSRGHGGGP